MYIFQIIKKPPLQKVFYKNIFTKSYILKYWVLKNGINILFILKKSVCKCIILMSLLLVFLCFSIVRWNIVSGYSFFLWNINGAVCLLSDFQLHDGGTPRGLQMWCEVYASISHFLSQLSWKKWRVSLGKKKWRVSLGRLKSYN